MRKVGVGTNHSCGACVPDEIIGDPSKVLPLRLSEAICKTKYLLLASLQFPFDFIGSLISQTRKRLSRMMETWETTETFLKS